MQHLVEHAALVQGDHRVVERGGEGDGPIRSAAREEGMAAGGDHPDRIGAEVDDRQTGQVFGVGNDTEVAVAIPDRGHGLRAVELEQLQADVRPTLAGVLQEIGQPADDGRGNGGDPDPASVALGKVPEGGVELPNLGQEPAAVFREDLARGGKHDPAGATLEQGRPERQLQVVNATADRGGCDVLAPGGTGYAAGFSNRQEQSNGDDVEALHELAEVAPSPPRPARRQQPRKSRPAA